MDQKGCMRISDIYNRAKKIIFDAEIINHPPAKMIDVCNLTKFFIAITASYYFGS